MALISVLIPVFNHAKELDECLASLEKQTFNDFEVIVVDDGSADDVASIVHDRALLKPVTFVRLEKNQGAPAARNEGFRHSSGTYAMFLDADAKLVPDAFEIMKNILETDGRYDFVYCPVEWYRDWFGVGWIGGGPFDPEKLKLANYIHTSALIRRSAFPGFDESLKKFQDWDLFLTMIERGSRGAAVKRPLYSIKERKSGMSRWLPSFVHRLPWPIFGWMPEEIRRYRAAESVIRKKHSL